MPEVVDDRFGRAQTNEGTNLLDMDLRDLVSSLLKFHL